MKTFQEQKQYAYNFFRTKDGNFIITDGFDTILTIQCQTVTVSVLLCPYS